MWVNKLDNGKFKFVERYYDHEGRQKFVSKTLKSNSAQAWKQAQKILDKKIEEPENPLTTHIFRHTFITRMVEQYVPATLIAEHVGHSDTQMIERVYNHFSEKTEEDLKTAINAIKF